MPAVKKQLGKKKRNSLVCPKDAHSPTAGGGGAGWGWEMESKRQAEDQVRQDPGGRGLEFDLQCKRSPCRGEGRLQEDRSGGGAVRWWQVQAGGDVAADMERGSCSRYFWGGEGNSTK